MTRYNVWTGGGDIEATNQTLEGAARVMLHYDGSDFELREDDYGPGFRLWHKTANGRWSETMIFSTSQNGAAAEADIFAQVVAKPVEWFRCEAEPIEPEPVAPPTPSALLAEAAEHFVAAHAALLKAATLIAPDDKHASMIADAMASNAIYSKRVVEKLAEVLP